VIASRCSEELRLRHSRTNITINLAPADIRKARRLWLRSPHGVGILGEYGGLNKKEIPTRSFRNSLSTAPARSSPTYHCIEARSRKIRRSDRAGSQRGEAAMSRLEVYPVNLCWTSSTSSIPARGPLAFSGWRPTPQEAQHFLVEPLKKFADSRPRSVLGACLLRRAQHLMIGRRLGKTMLAKRIRPFWPPSLRRSAGTTKFTEYAECSIPGGLVGMRPFRAHITHL